MISLKLAINRFVLIVNFRKHFDKALAKKLVTQGLTMYNFVNEQCKKQQNKSPTKNVFFFAL